MLLSSAKDRNIGFSAEIICEIISYLHGDKKTLLALGRVSKQALYESRPLLFSTVDFSGPRNGSPIWKDFHRFLRLVDVAWTSFTPTIQCISILYPNNILTDDDTRRHIPLARILMNLHNVKSLRLSNMQRSYVPSYILDLVLQLPIENLSLFLCDASNIPKLLNRIAPSLKTLDMTGMSFAQSSLTPFRVSSLDSRSLYLFKSVRDPSICRDLDIKMKAFHLCSSHDKSHGSMRMFNVVQEFLSALPSPGLLQEIRIVVKLVAPSLEEELTMLQLFEWSKLMETIQRLFPSLKKLAIRIGARSPSRDPNPYLDLLRRFSDVQKLEKEGLIELCAV